MLKLLMVAIFSMVQAPNFSITAVPTAAEVNQVVTFVAVGDVSIESIWSCSGGEWCLYKGCLWSSDGDLIAVHNPLWRATEAGTYTITLTQPDDSAATVTIVVTAPAL